MDTILSLVMLYAGQYGVDPKLALAVIKTESNFNCNARGAKGEIGLMQLMPAYYPVNEADLYNARTNLKYGIRYLAQMQRDCVHREASSFLVCFNRGLAGGAKVVNPYQDAYYQKVMQVYQSGDANAEDLALQNQ
jgi:soluble lytic murein transglycosylase-like protein